VREQADPDVLVAGGSDPTAEDLHARVGVRDLAGLSRVDLARNLAYLLSVWAVIAAAAWVAVQNPRWWVIALALVVISSRQQALLNIEHDCVHSTFVPGRKHNVLLAETIVASPVGSPFHAARARHLAHHRLLGSDEDPDGPLHKGDGMRTATGLLRHFAFGLAGGYAAMVLLGGEKELIAVDPETRRRDRRNVVLSQIVLAGVATATLAWWAYPLLWLVPLATLTAFCHLLRNYTEHALLPAEENAHPSRLITVHSPRAERALVAPFNMNLHAEHHLYPFVPARKLPELQKRLNRAGDGPSRLVRGGYARTLVNHLRRLR
jgi:fatty acid desaturase